MGRSELLVGDVLRERRREDVVISVKFGALRGPDFRWSGHDGRPDAVANYLAYSLTRLGTDYVDIYRPSRVDPDVPIEDTVGAVSELIDKGYVRFLGLSEAGPDSIRRANAVYPVSDLQIEYSLFSRGIEQEILPVCRELGIAITAYGILSRGLLSGHWSASKAVARGDMRGRSPRYAEGNLTSNLELVEALRAVARERGATVAQAAIAWVGSRGADIFPLIGAKTRAQLAESLGALDLKLSVGDIDAIEQAVPASHVAGGRYPDEALALLDSERVS
jgi:aryl-alcohol dehydrogenase-like predicted oxidoreductase